MDGWRVRYSNLMSTVAVVIALTGGSLAVAASVGRDDVGSKQVRDESLKSRDLADGRAVGGTDIVNGSVGADDLAQLPHAVVTATATQTFFDGSTDHVGLDAIGAIDQVGFDDGFDSLVLQRPGMYLITDGSAGRQTRPGRDGSASRPGRRSASPSRRRRHRRSPGSRPSRRLPGSTISTAGTRSISSPPRAQAATWRRPSRPVVARRWRCSGWGPRLPTR